MFLDKLSFNKKELVIIAIVTMIFIAGLGVYIGITEFGPSYDSSDLHFLGYQFTVREGEAEMTTPYDEQIIVEIDEDNEHDIEKLGSLINRSYKKLITIIRDTIIFLYLLFFTIIMIKKKENYLQGLIMGFLIGASLLLLLFILNDMLTVRGMLISFEHDLGHLAPVGH